MSIVASVACPWNLKIRGRIPPIPGIPLIKRGKKDHNHQVPWNFGHRSATMLRRPGKAGVESGGGDPHDARASTTGCVMQEGSGKGGSAKPEEGNPKWELRISAGSTGTVQLLGGAICVQASRSSCTQMNPYAWCAWQATRLPCGPPLPCDAMPRIPTVPHRWYQCKDPYTRHVCDTGGCFQTFASPRVTLTNAHVRAQRPPLCCSSPSFSGPLQRSRWRQRRKGSS